MSFISGLVTNSVFGINWSVTPKCAIITATYSTFIGSLWCSLRYKHYCSPFSVPAVLKTASLTLNLMSSIFLVASAQAASRKISIFFFYLSFIVLDKNVPLSSPIKIYMRHYLIKTLCSLIQWSSCSSRLLTEEEKSWLIKLIPSFPIISHPEDGWFCSKNLL